MGPVGFIRLNKVEVADSVRTGEIRDHSAVDVVRGGDDAALGSLTEHLGEPDHRHGLGRDDVGQDLARSDRRQLIDVAHQQQGGGVGKR